MLTPRDMLKQKMLRVKTICDVVDSMQYLRLVEAGHCSCKVYKCLDAVRREE